MNCGSTFGSGAFLVVKTWSNMDSDKHQAVASFPTRELASEEADRLNAARPLGVAYYVKE
jgi:hypothetical protein